MGGTQTPPPGWYPDPQQRGGQRFWDGQQWTPGPPVYGPPQPAPVVARRWPLRQNKTVALIVGGIVLVAVIAVYTAHRADDQKTGSVSLTSAEQNFLDAMDGPRVEMLSRESAGDVLAVGHAMCDALNSGSKFDQAVRQVRATHQLAYREDVLTAANFAPRYLCPALAHNF